MRFPLRCRKSSTEPGFPQSTCPRSRFEGLPYRTIHRGTVPGRVLTLGAGSSARAGPAARRSARASDEEAGWRKLTSQLQIGWGNVVEGRMIRRYARPEMTAIWSPETKFRIWFEIEAHAAQAMAELGTIPKDAAKKIWKKGKSAKFDVARIDAIEAEVKHDVIAFLTHLSEIVGPEARFVHSGMTSSDVLDTCLNVQLVRAADILIADVDALLAALKRRALEHKLTPTVGRSHGIHAEPTTFGLKLAYAYAEFARAKERLISARKEVATCAISGAVGTFAQVDPRVEAHVAKAMGLSVEPISTQVIPRDRHAMYFATL